MTDAQRYKQFRLYGTTSSGIDLLGIQFFLQWRKTQSKLAFVDPGACGEVVEKYEDIGSGDSADMQKEEACLSRSVGPSTSVADIPLWHGKLLQNI